MVNSWMLKREYWIKQQVSLGTSGVKAAASTKQTHRVDGQRGGEAVKGCIRLP